MQQKIKGKGVAMQKDTISNNKIKGNGVTFWKHVERASSTESGSISRTENWIGVQNLEPNRRTGSYFRIVRTVGSNVGIFLGVSDSRSYEY